MAVNFSAFLQILYLLLCPSIANFFKNNLVICLCIGHTGHSTVILGTLRLMSKTVSDMIPGTALGDWDLADMWKDQNYFPNLIIFLHKNSM